MTTTKNPVSRKIGIIALSCALLALTLLSGSYLLSGCLRNYRLNIDASIKECHQQGGTATVTQQINLFGPYISYSCIIPPSSASGAKAASKDADTDGDGIPDANDPNPLGLTSPSASGAKK